LNLIQEEPAQALGLFVVELRFEGRAVERLGGGAALLV
jgi:hypothetical protein